MLFLSVDVGTTCIKYGLYNELGNLVEYNSSEYQLKNFDNQYYVDIDKIVETIRNILSKLSINYKINSVSFSSIGESFVLLDEQDNIIFYPMLYTDNRGEEQAKKICNQISEEEYFNTFGIVPHSMYSISKLLYIKEKHSDIFAKAKKVMLVCDYLGYILTGERVIDYSLAARTGVFDIEKKQFSSQVLNAFGMNNLSFSSPAKTGTIVGKIKEQFGLDEALLVLGSHDQICATLGAGVFNVGDAADGMGTVECITAIYEGKSSNLEMGEKGYPCVPFLDDNTYCTYILNFSCGSAVNFFRKKLLNWDKEKNGDFFECMEKNIDRNPTAILTLPYFSGAGTPYQDNDACGAILGLKTTTDTWEVYQSILEATAYEMKLNMEVVEKYGIKIQNIVATGGGANSPKWLQKKADIQGIPVKRLQVSEGGLCGLAMLQSVALKTSKNLVDAKEKFVKYGYEFLPDKTYSEQHIKQYSKYKKLYSTLKCLL